MSTPAVTPPESPKPEYPDRTFDLFKHMTTLNFAAIALVFVLYDQNLAKVDKETGARWAILCFGGSMVASFYMMMYSSTGDPKEKIIFKNIFKVCAIVGFCLGIAYVLEIAGILTSAKK